MSAMTAQRVAAGEERGNPSNHYLTLTCTLGESSTYSTDSSSSTTSSGEELGISAHQSFFAPEHTKNRCIARATCSACKIHFCTHTDMLHSHVHSIFVEGYRPSAFFDPENVDSVLLCNVDGTIKELYNIGDPATEEASIEAVRLFYSERDISRRLTNPIYVCICSIHGHHYFARISQETDTSLPKITGNSDYMQRTLKAALMQHIGSVVCDVEDVDEVVVLETTYGKKKRARI